MQRIRTILQKLTDLAQRNPERSAIDIDLMLDYTRVVYADLLEVRAGMGAKHQLNISEPTLDELTMAMASREDEESDDDDDINLPVPPLELRIKNEEPVMPVTTVTEEKISIPEIKSQVPEPLKPLPIPEPVREEKPVVQEPKQALPESQQQAVSEPLKPIPTYGTPTKDAKDIRTFIDLNDKYLFLAELFNNDIRAYEDTMKELNRHDSKHQAQQFLGAKFLNEDNPACTNFQRLLDRFFEQ